MAPKLYSMTSGSLWNYYRDKINDDANENDNNSNNTRLNNNKIITTKSFEYKTKLIIRTLNNNIFLKCQEMMTMQQEYS